MARTVRAVYHGHYNVRDQRGHYVKPKTARGQLCHHSCCNGTRVHPDKLPVKISRSYLRTLTEPQLERELNAYMNYSETHEQGMTQIIAELDHREDAEKLAAGKARRAYLRSLTSKQLEEEDHRRGEGYFAGDRAIADEQLRRDKAQQVADARKQRAYDRRQARQSEWRDEVYRQWLSAESATNGVMLNNKTLREIKAGKRADINERDLFTGPERNVAKYASPELIEFFENNPRPTRASFLGTARERRAHLAGRRIG